MDSGEGMKTTTPGAPPSPSMAAAAGWTSRGHDPSPAAEATDR